MQSVPEKNPSRSEGNCSGKPPGAADPEMVVTLGPGKFYGSSLPRPRFYTDVKLNEERVSPPVPVLDPLMSWAEEAHWSMGGLNFQRYRFQGRIEGNVKKLRAEHERDEEKNLKAHQGSNLLTTRRFVNDNSTDISGSCSSSPVTPAAPVAVKRRRRLVGVVDDEESSDVVEEGNRREVKKTARKLGAEFDGVAPAAPVAVKRRRRLVDGLVDDEKSSDVVEGDRIEVKKTARKLGAEFDCVANDGIGDNPAVKSTVAEPVAARTRKSRRALLEEEMVFEEETKVKSEVRRLIKKTSPRLVKHG